MNNYNEIYDDNYFKSQLRKFLCRKGNHWTKRIEKVFDLTSKLELSGNKVLDLGTSIGTFAYEFSERGYKVTGIDLGKRAISMAEGIARIYNKNINYVVGDITDRNNFNSEEFDIIYAGDIVEHLLDNELATTVGNCFYWLKPGGHFIFHTVPTRYNIIFHRSPLWILLIPFAILPEMFFKKTVEILFSLFNISLKIITGKSYIERERQTVHCNLQTKEKISAMLQKCGFEILFIELTIMEDRFLKGMKKYLFRNKEYFQKDIFGVLWKPFKFPS
ncbi:MAG: class I SAM-dependent methyltransferase [Nitrospirae bacterium]|nr:class I SAM-dependent methyltransferase [Nitrospirota bacterium]